MAEIPKKYKAVVYDEPGKVSTKVVELDMPEPGPGQVLINLTHSGVCHSDLGVMTNRWAALPAPTQAGQVGGHEGVGKVVKLGPGAEQSTVKVGDRVGIKWVSILESDALYNLVLTRAIGQCHLWILPSLSERP